MKSKEARSMINQLEKRIRNNTENIGIVLQPIYLYTTAQIKNDNPQ